MPQILQRALHPPIAPRRVLPRHPHRDGTNLLQDTWPPDALSCGGPLPRDQLPVPAQEGVRGDERRDLRQHPPSEAVPGRCESTPLGIGEAQAPPAYLLFEHAILLAQIGNHVKLMAIDPAGESDQQHLPADGVEHPPSLPATAAIRARPNFWIGRYPGSRALPVSSSTI